MQPVLEELDRMSEERFLALYEGLADGHGFGPLDGHVAKILKFRPQAIRKLPMPTRAKRARSLIERDAELAYELFGSHLVRHHRELITGFLDATGVEHEDGMISDVEAAQPDPKKLDEAVSALDEKFPPGDVTLYLSMCAQQWPTVDELEELWSRRSGA